MDIDVCKKVPLKQTNKQNSLNVQCKWNDVLIGDKAQLCRQNWS